VRLSSTVSILWLMQRSSLEIRVECFQYRSNVEILDTGGEVRPALVSAHPEMANLPDIGVARKI
jgi:hypothetical protein